MRDETHDAGSLPKVWRYLEILAERLRIMSDPAQRAFMSGVLDGIRSNLEAAEFTERARKAAEGPPEHDEPDVVGNFGEELADLGAEEEADRDEGPPS